MARSSRASCLDFCAGSSKRPPSPNNEPSRLASVPFFPDIPLTSPFRSRKKISRSALRKKAMANGPASWSTASRLSRPEDMVAFRAIFEDRAFLGLESADISPARSLRTSTNTIGISPEIPGKSSELEAKRSSRSLSKTLRERLSLTRIRKKLSMDSNRSSLDLRKRHSRRQVATATATGSSEEETERRAELKRLRNLRIQEELEGGGYDSDARSIGGISAVSSAKTRVADLREQLRRGGSLQLIPFSAFEWTPRKLSTNALFTIAGREGKETTILATPSNLEPRSDSLSDVPAVETTDRMRRHSTPAKILPALDVDFYTPTHPRDSVIPMELPATPTLRPVKLPSIADETARRTSWRLSYASERRASHLRSLSGQQRKSPGQAHRDSVSQARRSSNPLGPQSQMMVQPQVVVYEMPSPAPLRSWLHSQGLRIPSEIIDDLSSAGEGESISGKKLRKTKVLSNDNPISDKEDFGGVDGPREASPQPQVLHLHEMGISQRLASRGLLSSASSPQLSICGSRSGASSHYGSGRRRGTSAISSGANSRYSRHSNLSPAYSTRYFPQKSKRSRRTQSDSDGPRGAHPRDAKDEDTSKSGQNSSDQSGFSSLISGYVDMVDGARDVEKLDMGKNVDGANEDSQAPVEVKRIRPIAVPSRTSSARNSPQKGSSYKIDQILHTGKHDGRSASLGRVEVVRTISDAEEPNVLVPQRVSDAGTWHTVASAPDSALSIRPSIASLNGPVARWMARASTVDNMSSDAFETRSFQDWDTRIKRIDRRVSADDANNIHDSSLLASETQSFKERERELISVGKRFTLPGISRDPKQPVKSKFKEEFGRPSCALRRSIRRSIHRPHSILSMLHLPKRKTKADVRSIDGAAMEGLIDGADDVGPTSSGADAWSHAADAAGANSVAMAPVSAAPAIPNLRGPPRGPAGGKPPKAAPAMAPAMEPSKGQKRRAMRQKLASWEDELAAVEKAARDKSKGVAPAKRYKHKDGWDPVKWSSFPSHDRHERTESAGAVDHIATADFSIKARSASGNPAEWNHQERKIYLEAEENKHIGPLTFRQRMAESIRNRILRTASVFETDASNGRRSSISAEGDIEFPELEIVQGTEASGDLERMEAEVEEALRLEEEMKANERAADKKREEARARRALMQAPKMDGSGEGGGSFDGGLEVRDSFYDAVADPRFYDDCVVEPAVGVGRDERKGKMISLNKGKGGGGRSSSIQSTRTTGSIQFETEIQRVNKGKGKEKAQEESVNKVKERKFATWNGHVLGHAKGKGKGKKKSSSSSGNLGAAAGLRPSTLDFERDLERDLERERGEMEVWVRTKKMGWGVV